MNENVITGSALDKTVALRVVEPLYLALFLLHMFRCSFNSVDSLVPLSQPNAKSKKATKPMILWPPYFSASRSQKLIKSV
jgi:hypothetical protein